MGGVFDGLRGIERRFGVVSYFFCFGAFDVDHDLNIGETRFGRVAAREGPVFDAISLGPWLPGALSSNPDADAVFGERLFRGGAIRDASRVTWPGAQLPTVTEVVTMSLSLGCLW